MHERLKIKTEHRPLYAVLAERLSEEIRHGIFANETMLPSEEKLAKMFGVSRATVREALSVLERQDQLRRVQGVGTLLTHKEKIPIGHGMERLCSYTEYVSRYGFTPGTSSIEFHWEAVRPEHREVLGPDVETVGVLIRTRTADGEPLMISEDIMPMDVLGLEFQVEYLKESLFAYLQNRGVVLAYSEMRLTAAVADRAAAEKLEVDAGSPLLVIDETYYNHKNRPVLISRNTYRVDRWELIVYRTRTEQG